MPERENEVFSNPMAPTNEPMPFAQPLTNDDFRKLLMTPRAPSGSAKETATPKPAQPKQPKQPAPVKTTEEGDLDPNQKRKEKKIYYAKLKRLEEERQKELANKYRDRASERRQGANKDYAETETISTTADYRAVAPNAQADANYAERRKQLIQESKYLGGDMEHTHLVKGLDYALLEKVRAEICHKEEAEEEEMEQVVETTKEKEEDPEDKIEFRTKLGRNIYRTVFKTAAQERNELFMPGRMAYSIDLEDEYAESDIPTTLIRSKADVQNTEASITFTTNDIVINKLTQILSYLRQGRRDRKKKLKEKAKREGDRLKLGADDSIYGELGDYNPTVKKEKEKEKSSSGRDRDRDRKDRERDRDRDRYRERERGRHERERDQREQRERREPRAERESKRSYFEKPAEEEDLHDRKLPTSAKELVHNINTRFSAHAPPQQHQAPPQLPPPAGAQGDASWTEKFPTRAVMDQAEAGQPPQEETPTPAAGGATGGGGKRKKKTLDSYAECYPGLEEAYDAYGDSDDEVDYTKMDQGNKKGPVGRWDFDTQEEYSDYMSNKEALPKAAFQYGVKMADGRRTRRTGPKDEKKELDREWQKIQNIISKRKQMGMSGGRSPKSARY